MNATEELRALLDAKGVEWWPMHDVEAGYYQDHDTEFVVDGRKYTAHEWGGRLTVYGLTPAQAVEATLWRGTCEMEYVSDFMSWHCKACDQMDMAPRNPKPRYCKWCGRKVVDE